jgi:hypothetical protein
MTDVHKVTIQIRVPRWTFPGEVAEGYLSMAMLCSLTRPASRSTVRSIIWLRARTRACYLSIDTTAPQ